MLIHKDSVCKFTIFPNFHKLDVANRKNTSGFIGYSFFIAPIVPSQDSLFTVNQTFIIVNLEAWIEGGCNIHKFIIEYKQKGNRDWILIGNEVLPERKFFIIPELAQNKTYSTKISAISEAGLKTVEYDVTTLSTYKGKNIV